MTKTAKVLEHLQNNKSITSMQAIQLYKATRLSAIIFNLRKRGYNISTLTGESQDEDGRPIYYGIYVMKEDK